MFGWLFCLAGWFDLFGWFVRLFGLLVCLVCWFVCLFGLSGLLVCWLVS